MIIECLYLYILLSFLKKTLSFRSNNIMLFLQQQQKKTYPLYSTQVQQFNFSIIVV